MNKRKWAMESLLLLGLVAVGNECAGQGAITSLFQKGVAPTSGYSQCQDSTLRSLVGNTFGMQSLGQDAALTPRWSDSEGAELLWFDISSIPTYATVSSATVRVRFEPDEFEEASGNLEIYRLSDPDGTGLWQENTNATEVDYGTADPSNAFGCAAYKRPNVAWTMAGGQVLDVTNPVVRAWHVAGTPEWIELDVTAAAQDFVLAPASNLGWLVRAEVDNTLRGDLFTCDAADSAKRPQLQVVYGVPDTLPPTAEAGPDQLLTDADNKGWEMVILDGSASSDPDGWIENYAWSTGGVEIATGELMQEAMPVGTNWVTLTVMDNDGLEDEDTVRVVVRPMPTNEPPTADAGSDQRVTDTDNDGWAWVDLDGTASSDPDGWIADYTWSTGGVGVATGASAQVELPLGTNWVTLTVTDDGALEDEDPVQIVVQSASTNEPPVADAGPDQLLTDEEGLGWLLVDLGGSASSDPDGWIENYSWSTGGVEIATGEYIQEPMPLGTNWVTLTVTDNDGLAGEDTVQVVIRPVPTNEPPVLLSIGNRSAWVSYELRFSINATDTDGDSVLFTASNLPPGATFLAPQFSWTPTAGQTGLFAGVSFHANDGHGGFDSESIDITVREATTGGTTWYVRVDGGTPQQCTGLADAPYPGSGSNQPCAWDHPFRALPPGGTPRITGGDTLIVGSGSYRMGYGAPATEACSSDWPWSCHMPPIPSGPNPANPTRILGAGWAAGCTNPPELWGTERALFILNLTGVTNVEVGCLEVTDHAGCVEFHSGGIPCPRDSFPYGDWSPRGIYAEDAQNVYLHDLDIHGLANEGIQAGRLSDWNVENVRVAGNGWAGWDGDISGEDGNSGMMEFRNFTVEWNGCGETYPGGSPTGCWAQSAGGYGDGLGTGATGGEWIFEDSAFLHNTSDGLDLLYVTRPDGSITIRHTRAEGNAGNQLKTAGPARIENCIAVGNCGFFEGQPFTYFVDPCRAFGSTLSLTLGPGEQATIVNSTITGEGDGLVLAVAQEGCNGTERIVLRNNIFIGNTDFHQPFENTALTWGEGFPVDPFDMDYSVVTGVKNDPCPVGAHDICGNPLLAGMSLDAFDAMPLSNSPAIDAGLDLPEVGRDFAGHSRPLDGRHDGTNRWDIGAMEYVHPQADSDQDAMRDADEIVAGTDPTNATSFLAIDAIPAGPGLVLQWWGVLGRRYDIQYATQATGAWSAVLGGTNLPGWDAPLRFTNTFLGSAHFYRLSAQHP